MRRSWRNAKRSCCGGRSPSGLSGRNVGQGSSSSQRAEQVAAKEAVLACRLLRRRPRLGHASPAPLRRTPEPGAITACADGTLKGSRTAVPAPYGVFGSGQLRKWRTKPWPSRERCRASRSRPLARAVDRRSLGRLSRAMPADRHDTIVVGAGILGLAVAREILAPAPGRARARRRARGGARGAPEQPQLRRDPRRHLLRAGLAEGAAVRRRRGADVRLLRGQRDRRAPDRQADRRAATRASCPRSTSSSGARTPTACPACGAWTPPACATSSRTPTGIAALHSPGTGIVDFGAVGARLAADVRAAGGELRCGWPVSGVDARDARSACAAATGDEAQATRAIFCAGLWSDRLAVLAGADPDPRIVPFRGAYLQLRPERRALVRGLIYPVPDPRLPFLGVHLTPRIDGEVLLGPSALLVGARDGVPRCARCAPPTSATRSPGPAPGGWRALVAHRPRTSCAWPPAAPPSPPRPAATSRRSRAEDLLPAFAGVRAQAVARDGRLVDDFLLVRDAARDPRPQRPLARRHLGARARRRSSPTRADCSSRDDRAGAPISFASPAMGDDGSPMRILLTGASGSIGAALAPALDASRPRAARLRPRSGARARDAGVRARRRDHRRRPRRGAGRHRRRLLPHPLDGGRRPRRLRGQRARRGRELRRRGAARRRAPRRLPRRARAAGAARSRVTCAAGWRSSGSCWRALPEAVALRASIVIGARSRSFRFMVHLVERMKVLALPPWREHRTQPIDARDVGAFLLAAATTPHAARRVVTGYRRTRRTDLRTDDRAHRRPHARAPPRAALRRATRRRSSRPIAAAIAGEDTGFIAPLMESLAGDLLPRDDRAPACSACAFTASTARSSGRCASGRPASRWRRDDAVDLAAANARFLRPVSVVIASIDIDAPLQEVWDTSWTRRTWANG